MEKTKEEITEIVNKIMEEDGYKFAGVSNYGKPKTEYLKKLIAMDNDKFFAEIKNMVWLSAYAANNPRSDYHWQCDACWVESNRRGENQYKKAYDEVYKEEFGG